MGNSSNVCLTPQCVTAAAEILHNLHPNYTDIDPCTDFDQYVCGGYAQRFPAESNPEVLGRIQNTNIHIIQTMLENAEPANVTVADEAEILELLLQNYASCMNETAVNATGPAGIAAIVSELTELFPIDDYASNDTMTDEDLDAFVDATAYLASIGVNLFGDFSTYQDMENPDTVVPWYTVVSLYRIDRTLPAPQKTYTALAEEGDLIFESLLALLPDQDVAPQLAEGIVAMAKALAVLEALLPVDDASFINGTWEMSTVAEAGRLAPALGIDKVITKLAPEGYQPDRMMLSFTDIYSNLSDVVTATPKPVLQAFMLLQTSEYYAPFIVAAPSEDRMKEVCFTYLDNSLPWILGKFFVDQVYSEEDHQAYTSMTEDVKKVFVERTQNTSWLSGEDQRLVTEKAQDVQLNIGYPEEEPDSRNATSLKAYYAGVNITDSWISNAVSLRQWDTKTNWDAVLSPPNRLKWLEHGVHPYLANARASREKNMIMLPATLTDLPLSDYRLPLYAQYSRVGYLAAHEIVHNFDNLGMLLSNERTTGEWLSAETVAAYGERANCIREQFAEVPAVLANGQTLIDPLTNKTLYINGNLTLSENIADTGGLSVAYEAWERTTVKGCGTEDQQTLPGLENFTKEQLFFISFGQTWCADYTEEVMQRIIAGEVHAPGFARTRITPGNVEGFKKVWQCKNPEPECKIW
ncbi:hypothetical protein F5X68DRAFT_37745 [Plectosphaerella plurivora]|uniref:Endothelin-converting enzyme 1 n=1 Tax=Plectosphaerella plurivora TaxID=936078 RepID=A0A9P8V523_9PEZI|nr:hypothetical protein F5X68DRAFT_37745 [Plectosphaerella plurivora]